MLNFYKTLCFHSGLCSGLCSGLWAGYGRAMGGLCAGSVLSRLQGKEGRPHPPTPHTPLPTHPPCHLSRSVYPKGGRDGVCRGSGASEKKSRRATTRRPPPHTPTCNIAWIACMGRFVRAQNRLFFRSPIRRLGHICPTQYYIGGSGGVRWPANRVGSFFARTGISVLPLKLLSTAHRPAGNSAARSVLAVRCHGASLVAGRAGPCPRCPQSPHIARP